MVGQTLVPLTPRPPRTHHRQCLMGDTGVATNMMHACVLHCKRHTSCPWHQFGPFTSSAMKQRILTYNIKRMEHVGCGDTWQYMKTMAIACVLRVSGLKLNARDFDTLLCRDREDQVIHAVGSRQPCMQRQRHSPIWQSGTGKLAMRRTGDWCNCAGT